MSVIDTKHFLSTLLLLVGDLYLNLITMKDIILLSKIGECYFLIFLILLLNDIAHSQKHPLCTAVNITRYNLLSSLSF